LDEKHQAEVISQFSRKKKRETEVPGRQGRGRRNIVVTIVIVVVVDVQPIIIEVERTATSPHHLLLKPFIV
jgi:hypothetical protein